MLEVQNHSHVLEKEVAVEKIGTCLVRQHTHLLEENFCKKKERKKNKLLCNESDAAAAAAAAAAA